VGEDEDVAVAQIGRGTGEESGQVGAGSDLRQVAQCARR